MRVPRKTPSPPSLRLPPRLGQHSAACARRALCGGGGVRAHRRRGLEAERRGTHERGGGCGAAGVSPGAGRGLPPPVLRAGGRLDGREEGCQGQGQGPGGTRGRRRALLGQRRRRHSGGALGEGVRCPADVCCGSRTGGGGRDACVALTRRRPCGLGGEPGRCSEGGVACAVLERVRRLQQPHRWHLVAQECDVWRCIFDRPWL